MNKKLLAVAIPAALFAGSVSAYDVVVSDDTSVTLTGKVGAEYKVVDSYKETAKDSGKYVKARAETNQVTSGTGALKVEVKHALNDTTDALGGINFDLKSGDKIASSGRYIGVSLVGGEHIVKYGQVDLPEAVGPAVVAYVENDVKVHDNENVVRYTFSNDTVTLDAAFDDASETESETQQVKKDTNGDLTDELETVKSKSDKDRIASVKATTEINGFKIDVGYVDRAKGKTNLHHTSTGVAVETTIDAFTVDAAYSVLNTKVDAKDASDKPVVKDVNKTGAKAGIKYVVDALTLNASYQVVSSDEKDSIDAKTTKLGAEYVMDKWTYNADLTVFDDGKDDKQTAKVAAKYKFTENFNVSASYEAVDADKEKDDKRTYLVGAELTW